MDRGKQVTPADVTNSGLDKSDAVAGGRPPGVCGCQCKDVAVAARADGWCGRTMGRTAQAGQELRLPLDNASACGI